MQKPFIMQAPPHWASGILAGPDAADFLQRLSTAHIRALAVGPAWLPATFLNAQGKIQAAFYLRRAATDRFELQTGHWERLAQFVDLYTFAEKQQLTRTTSAVPLALSWTPNEDGSIAFSVQQEAETPAAPAFDAAAWAAFRVQVGLPDWEHEITSDTNPLEIHFEAAIAANKGCYPGQEVIERTLALGSPARRLCQVRLGASGGLPTGWEITTRGRANLVLALARKTVAKPGAIEQSDAECLRVF